MTRYLYWFRGFVTTFIAVLYLSITSSEFYRRVAERYQGYGFKLIFVICIISSIFPLYAGYQSIKRIEHALEDNELKGDLENLGIFIEQFPEAIYQHEQMRFMINTPYYIYKNNGSKLVLIDPENKTTPNERYNIPIIINDKKIEISWRNLVTDKYNFDYGRDIYKINFKDLFDANNNVRIDSDSLRVYMLNAISNSLNFYFIIALPLIVFGRFIAILLNKTLLIFATFIIAYLIRRSQTLKTSCRLIMFTSAITVLLQSLVIFSIYLEPVIFLLQIIALTLMTRGLYRTKPSH